MKYTIGLDLGVNNVGWSIYDNENEKIEKVGVRLFDASNDAKDRREIRNTRRRKKRKNLRVNDTLNLFKSIGFPNKITVESDLINKRCLGVNKKLEKQDIVNIVCFLMSHRGYIPYSDEQADFIELNGDLPCNYYKRIYKEKGKYRSSEISTVKMEDNIKELRTTLNNQKEYYPELDTIIEDIISIFTRKREFWEGPGSINSLTPYGRFRTNEDVEEYNKNKENNPGYEKYIFEDLIGKCKIALKEICAPKANYYAEQFNLLNDFININIKSVEGVPEQKNFVLRNNSYKLTQDGLKKVIDCCKKNPKITYPAILKSLGLKIDMIEGYRVDKNRKPSFSTMECYRSFKRNLIDNNCNYEWLDDIDVYNRIIYNMAIAPSSTEFLRMIQNDSSINIDFNDNEKEVFKTMYLKLKKAGHLNYHSLSEKVLKRAINDMITNQMNFMQVRRKFDYDKESREYFAKNYTNRCEGMPHISSKYVDDIIASPQVKKTLRQSIKIINAIIDEKKCLPEVIAIESTKDMNGADKRKEIEATQRKEEQLRKNAISTITTLFGVEKLNESNIKKVMLYDELDGECPYCGKVKIKIEDVIENRIEVEHILNLSDSGDDSYNNKTLSCPECNKNKGNRTPYEFLYPIGEFENFKKRINSLKMMGEEKKKNLLFEGSIDKHKTRFFHRNLRDTAYATTELINQINMFNYYLDEAYDGIDRILTLSTPGQLTHKVRERDEIKIEKDRDAGKFHHCVDASILVCIANTKIGKQIIKSQNEPNYWVNNGNKATKELYNLLQNFNFEKYIDELKNIDSDEKINMSFEVNKNPNKQLSDQNIIKMIKKDEGYKKIEQISNIYELNLKDASVKKNLEDLFDEENTTKTLLCYDNDKNLFYKLKDIYNKYKNDDGNPFINYVLDKEGLESGRDVIDNINKYGIKVSNKSNSPVVKKLRYYSEITTPYLIDKKNIHKNENTYIGFDSLKQFCTEVYVDKNENKFVFLPIYSISFDLNNNKLNKDEHYYKELYAKFIGDKDVRYVCSLYNGMYIDVIKKDGSIISGPYRGFHKNIKSIQLKNGSYFSKSDIGFKVYDIDVLGNKKIRLTEILK